MSVISHPLENSPGSPFKCFVEDGQEATPPSGKYAPCTIKLPSSST